MRRYKGVTKSMWPFQPNELVLFQGDSITDAGRSREDDSQLGAGYAALLAAWLPGCRLNGRRAASGS